MFDIEHERFITMFDAVCYCLWIWFAIKRVDFVG